MFIRGIVLVGCVTSAFGCAARSDETQEIIDNLVKVGFPASDIMEIDGIVYVGRDAEVSLAASREMVAGGDTRKEQYRTTNLVSRSLAKICVDGSTFTGVFGTALDLAIQNYDEQPLTFAMARTPSTGCSFTIRAVIEAGLVGGHSGFPSGGVPYGSISIGGGLSTYSADTIEHVITHEIGHTIGFRHSDYFNRSISCGTGGNEGDAGVGAILIPGTPSGATVGGSLMNSCFRTFETGEFTSTDVVALKALYAASSSSGNPFTYLIPRDQQLACYGISVAPNFPSNCRDITDFNDKQMCYGMSQLSQDPCRSMTDRNLQLACYGMSVAPNYPSNCRDITDIEMQNFCFGVSSGGSMPNCNNVTSGDTRALCLAMASHNSSFCANIINANDRLFCQGVAGRSQTPCTSIL